MRHLVSVGDPVVQVGHGVESEALHVFGHNVSRQPLSKAEGQLRLKVLEKLDGKGGAATSIRRGE